MRKKDTRKIGVMFRFKPEDMQSEAFKNDVPPWAKYSVTLENRAREEVANYVIDNLMNVKERRTIRVDVEMRFTFTEIASKDS